VVFDLKDVLIDLIRLRSKVYEININTVKATSTDDWIDSCRLFVVSICIANSAVADNLCNVVLSTGIEEL
jgi:hypothetical protein